MDYENELNKLSIVELKQFIKAYNLHTRIIMSKKKKDELIKEILKYTGLQNGKIYLKNIEIMDMPQSEQEKKEQEKQFKLEQQQIKEKMDKMRKVISNLFKDKDNKQREQLRLLLLQRTTDEQTKKMINMIVDELIKKDKFKKEHNS
jgi:hypothetical protein